MYTKWIYRENDMVFTSSRKVRNGGTKKDKMINADNS